MSLLTDQEITRICNGWPGNAEKAARAIEASVIAKLATVSVEPLAYVSEDELGYVEGGGRCGAFYGVKTNPDLKDDPDFVAVYTATQLAAARVQARVPENDRIEKHFEPAHPAYWDTVPATPHTWIGGKDD